MSVLFGHPTGNPNSHHAALAHFERGRLEAFCVPWMPSPAALAMLRRLPGLSAQAARLERRWFPPLADAPKLQGCWGEWGRMLRRLGGQRWAGEHLTYDANDWLMRTMARACRRTAVTAVHSYEDCSLWQFEEARRLGKACLYDMPIGYYPWWEAKQADLARRYADWLPAGGLESSRLARPAQKQREMELADLVLAPSAFVEATIREFHPDKKIARASYGVDLDFWQPAEAHGEISALRAPPSTLRFLFAGQVEIRKGIPPLIEAWAKANLKDAELVLVGTWKLAEARRAGLPTGVSHLGPQSRADLRASYQAADVFVFASFFEGLALALLEAMACGLPVIASEVVAGMNLVTDATGRAVQAGNVEPLVEALRWFSANRERLPEMKRAARATAERFTWQHYRQCVSQSVSSYL